VSRASAQDDALARIRAVCLALPEVTERPSHGAPTFFIRGKRSFAMVLTNHHGDGRFAIWCAAPDGAQRLLVEAEPERFFVPPYVGTRGWLGVRLDRGTDWEEIAGILEDAYAEVAPPKLLAAALSAAGRDRAASPADAAAAPSAPAPADAAAPSARPRG
jgi:hypothetical protein